MNKMIRAHFDKNLKWCNVNLPVLDEWSNYHITIRKNGKIEMFRIMSHSHELRKGTDYIVNMETSLKPKKLKRGQDFDFLNQYKDGGL
jgi:hypothetical protein